MNFRFVLFSVVEQRFGTNVRSEVHAIRPSSSNNDFNVFLLVLFSVAYDEQFFGTSSSRSEVRAISDISFCFVFVFSVEFLIQLIKRK